ncbi:Hypothetical predicted protein [Olea europaea subsp. europaea]|uniref:Uncharacterized protein n=2 Tax=Olea europaea subsp. europaea TaxID=158383 RepID=A0A8S0T807_OLEEU|nr:Hypothetical predicted protein [Olea europaea subsp. europaea]
MEEFNDVDQQANALSLIDLDYQFSENETEATTLQLSEAMGAQKEVFITINGDGNDQLPELWTEPESSQRNGRCNLRESLAWDSAFFTSSGVLEPEELSSMLKGAGKAGKHLLPGIEEDIRRSTESISTLESDSLTLGSLEDDLFSDIRASIQRSSRRALSMTNSSSNVIPVVIDNQAISCVLDPEELSSMLKEAGKAGKHLLPGIEEDIRRSSESISTLESDSMTLEILEDDLFSDIRASIQRSSRRAFTMTNSSCNVIPVVIDNQAISCLRKDDQASENQLNPKPAVKKRIGMQAIRISKCQSKQNIGLQGSGKAVEKDSGHFQVTQNGQSSSSLPKPRKAINRVIPTSTAAAKRSSLSSGVKTENEGTHLSTVATKGTQASKVPVLSGTKKVLLKPALSSKFSSLSSSTTSKMQSTRSTSSNSTVLPETTAKSTLMIARRNPIKSRTLNSASSGSIPKNLSKAKVKNDRSSSALSAYLVSAMTSNMSPTSSSDELSSASSSSSSSSSSTINRRSNNSRNSLDTSSGQSVGGDIVSLDLKNQYTNGIANGHKSRGTASPGNITRKSSTQASKAGTLSSQPPPKVSGLRMPSPKIGFFDGVTSSVSQSGIPTMLPEKGGVMCSSNRSSNIKPRLRKLPTARMVTALANTNSYIQKATPPISSEEKSYTRATVSTSLVDVEYGKSSVEVEGNTSRESCSNMQEVIGDDVKLDIDKGSRARTDENIGVLTDETVLNMHGNIGTENFEIVTSVDQKVDENVIDGQNHAKKSHPICRADRKESGHIGDQVDGVCEYKMDGNSNIHGQMDEIISEMSDCVSETSSAITSESAGGRAPFAVKNFL